MESRALAETRRLGRSASTPDSRAGERAAALRNELRGAQLGDLAELLGERLDHQRVELRSGTTLELRDCIVIAERLAVDAFRRHRIERVRDEDDARAEWN